MQRKLLLVLKKIKKSFFCENREISKRRVNPESAPEAEPKTRKLPTKALSDEVASSLVESNEGGDLSLTVEDEADMIRVDLEVRKNLLVNYDLNQEKFNEIKQDFLSIQDALLNTQLNQFSDYQSLLKSPNSLEYQKLIRLYLDLLSNYLQDQIKSLIVIYYMQL